MIRDTHHPIVVEAQKGQVDPCERQDECRLWGSGVVTLTETQWAQRSSVARLALVGCEVCGNPCHEDSDLGVVTRRDGLREFTPDIIEAEVRIAGACMADAIASLPKLPSTQQV